MLNTLSNSGVETVPCKSHPVYAIGSYDASIFALLSSRVTVGSKIKVNVNHGHGRKRRIMTDSSDEEDGQWKLGAGEEPNRFHQGQQG